MDSLPVRTQQPVRAACAVRALIFDLDGTIVDSEGLYKHSDRAFLSAWGIEYDDELNKAVMGKGASDFFAELEARFPDSPFHRLSPDERMQRKDEAYLAYALPRMRSFTPVATLVRALAAADFPIAVASGSNPAVIEASLSAVGLAQSIAIRVSAAQAARGKPHPDVFLLAASQLGVAPQACLALEDSPNGVRAALASGMRVVALPEPGSEGHEAFAPCDMVVVGGPAALDVHELAKRFGLPV